MPPVNIKYATSVTANVAADQSYFYILLTGDISGTFSFSFSPELPHSKTIHVVLQQDGTGGHAVTFASNVFGSPTISSDTAGLSRVVEYFYDESSSSWYAMSTAVS